MQDFRDKNVRQSAILDSNYTKFVMGQPFVRYSGSSYFALFFRYSNDLFEIACAKKLITSLPDIAEHICQIKRYAGNFFLKYADEHFFVSHNSN